MFCQMRYVLHAVYTPVEVRPDEVYTAHRHPGDVREAPGCLTLTNQSVSTRCTPRETRHTLVASWALASSVPLTPIPTGSAALASARAALLTSAVPSLAETVGSRTSRRFGTSANGDRSDCKARECAKGGTQWAQD